MERRKPVYISSEEEEEVEETFGTEKVLVSVTKIFGTRKIGIV